MTLVIFAKKAKLGFGVIWGKRVIGSDRNKKRPMETHRPFKKKKYYSTSFTLWNGRLKASATPL